MTEQKASPSPTSSSIRGTRANSEKRILKKVRRQKDALIAIGYLKHRLDKEATHPISGLLLRGENKSETRPR
jgi:hypothetical protein